MSAEKLDNLLARFWQNSDTTWNLTKPIDPAIAQSQSEQLKPVQQMKADNPEWTAQDIKTAMLFSDLPATLQTKLGKSLAQIAQSLRGGRVVGVGGDFKKPGV